MDDLTQFSTLLDKVYEGATNVDAWPDIAHAVADWMACTKCLLFTPQHAPHQDGFVVPFGLSEARLTQWDLQFRHKDEWLNRVIQQGLVSDGRILIGADILPVEELVQYEWYQTFLAPQDIGQVLSATVFGMGHKDMPWMALSLFRSLSDPAFSALQKQQLALLLPHLSRALGVMMRLRDADFKVASSLEALNRIKSGIALMGPQGHVTFLNLAARSLLLEDDGLAFRSTHVGGGSMLHVRDGRASEQVKRSIQLALDKRTDATHFSQAILVPRPSGKAPYRLQVSALGMSPGLSIPQGDAQVIVFLTDPHELLHVDAHALKSLFGLTDAEARVACALVDMGQSADIAQTMGVSVNTVKTQIKQIYDKLNVDTRAAFMRQVMCLASHQA